MRKSLASGRVSWAPTRRSMRYRSRRSFGLEQVMDDDLLASNAAWRSIPLCCRYCLVRFDAVPVQATSVYAASRGLCLSGRFYKCIAPSTNCGGTARDRRPSLNAGAWQVRRQRQHADIGQRLRMVRQPATAARETVRKDGGPAHRSGSRVDVQHHAMAVQQRHLRPHGRRRGRLSLEDWRDHGRPRTHQCEAEPACVPDQRVRGTLSALTTAVIADALSVPPRRMH